MMNVHSLSKIIIVEKEAIVPHEQSTCEYAMKHFSTSILFKPDAFFMFIKLQDK